MWDVIRCHVIASIDALLFSLPLTDIIGNDWYTIRGRLLWLRLCHGRPYSFCNIPAEWFFLPSKLYSSWREDCTVFAILLYSTWRYTIPCTTNIAAVWIAGDHHLPLLFLVRGESECTRKRSGRWWSLAARTAAKFVIYRNFRRVSQESENNWPDQENNVPGEHDARVMQGGHVWVDGRRLCAALTVSNTRRF